MKVATPCAAEQSLITVEGDKASMECRLRSRVPLKRFKINTGDKVSTGRIIMIFEVAVQKALPRLRRPLLRLRLLHQQLLAARERR